jgi:small subunit ribosomal protein S3
MGQKVNPIGLRLGIVRGWESNWFGGKEFGEKLAEDNKIRQYLKARMPRAGISKILIERMLKRIIDKLKEEIKKLTKKDVQINIFEVKRPELDAMLVGQSIAQQIEGRVNFKRAIKMAIGSTMRMGAQGIKVMVSGRLNGAEMARTQQFKEGRIPLHTFRADVDYALSEALTVYGKIGVKVWIFKEEVFGKRDLSINMGMGEPKQQRDKRGGHDRRRIKK